MFRCEELTDWQRLVDWLEAEDIVAWSPFANEHLEYTPNHVRPSAKSEFLGHPARVNAYWE